LHLSREPNRLALKALPEHPEDWLILAGDIGETETHLQYALVILTQRFRQLIWTPGNHDLWTLPSDRNGRRGESRYLRLVDICRKYGVLTPEDPFPRWNGPGPACTLAPVFTLYDYSFTPEDIPAGRAVEWAAKAGVVCADELLLYPEPYPSREAWCASRCEYTERRLEEAAKSGPIVLINHYPLRQDLVLLKRIPRFSPWCGTRRTESWLERFPLLVAIYGHLHIRGTYWRAGVRCEEVSFGYPEQWRPEDGLEPYLREILPGPQAAVEGSNGGK
jgi:3',5'-cyclic AMP phosphodiesterase CpdA